MRSPDLSGVGLRAEIDPKELTATITTPNKPYDGTTAPPPPARSRATWARATTVDFATSGNFQDKDVGTGKSVIATVHVHR